MEDCHRWSIVYRRRLGFSQRKSMTSMMVVESSTQKKKRQNGEISGRAVHLDFKTTSLSAKTIRPSRADCPITLIALSCSLGMV
jgi:hypothetical protein